jgi:hypothetical protein
MSMSHRYNKPTGTDHHPKTYRLALYGASGSGKTILLASLAADRISYHPNYTCTRIPLGQSVTDSTSAKPDVAEAPSPRTQKLQEGKKILDRAIEALGEGRMPDATPSNHPDMLFEYDFSTGERTYRIELMDYAGEWVDPTVSTTEKAVRLRQQLRNKDALLVLAPAPWPEDDHKALDPDLRSLQETFRLLCGERGEVALPIPFAMVFTKWDRRSRLEYRTPENEYREMEEFLDQDPPPPHRALYNTLRSAVADPANFKAFPLSALGECQKIDLGQGQWTERPDTFKPLRAFGLEDPFIWAVERRDAMDMAAYQAAIDAQNLTRLSCWIPWPFLLINLEKQGRALHRRFPVNDPYRAPVERLWQQVKSARNQRGMALGLTFAVSLLCGELLWDKIQFQQVKHTITDPEAGGLVVQSAESWLLDYTESSPLRHRLAKWLFLSQADAEAYLGNLRNEHEDIFWAEVNTTSNPEEKAKKAKEYLDKFPNGRYKAAALVIIAEIDDAKRWAEFLRSYYDLMQEVRTVEAAELLKARSGDPRTDPLIQDFESAALRSLEIAIKQALAQWQIEDASKLYLQIDLWPLDLNIRTETGRSKQETLLHSINVHHDRQLYDAARDYRTPSALRNYLYQAPLGSMKKAVENYLEWLNTKTSELALTLTVTSVIWGGATGHDDGIDLTVRLNDKAAITIPGLESRGNTTSPVNAAGYSFKAKLDETMTLDVSLQEHGWFRTHDWGKQSRKILVKELNGLRLTIRNDELNNIVTFGLKGIQDQPDLPNWKEG